MLSPAHTFYKDLANECIRNCITVDLFIAVTMKYKSLDVATMQPICKITGGDLHLFSSFDAVRDGEKLYYHIFRNLTRYTVTNVMIKLRVSTGLSIAEYFGHSDMETDFCRSALDQDKVFSALLKSDSTLKKDTPMYA